MDNITKILQEFCDTNDFSVEVIYAQDFFCYPNEDELYYALICDEFQDKAFMKNAFDKGLAYDCGSFIFSFLHELGHCQTEYLLTRGEKISRTKKKKNLDGSKEKDLNTYFNLPDEAKATEWAINYANSNRKKLQKLQEKVLTELNK